MLKIIEVGYTMFCLSVSALFIYFLHCCRIIKDAASYALSAGDHLLSADICSRQKK